MTAPKTGLRYSVGRSVTMSSVVWLVVASSASSSRPMRCGSGIRTVVVGQLERVFRGQHDIANGPIPSAPQQ